MQRSIFNYFTVPYRPPRETTKMSHYVRYKISPSPKVLLLFMKS